MWKNSTHTEIKKELRYYQLEMLKNVAGKRRIGLYSFFSSLCFLLTWYSSSTVRMTHVQNKRQMASKEIHLPPNAFVQILIHSVFLTVWQTIERKKTSSHSLGAINVFLHKTASQSNSASNIRSRLILS